MFVHGGLGVAEAHLFWGRAGKLNYVCNLDLMLSIDTQRISFVSLHRYRVGVCTCTYDNREEYLRVYDSIKMCGDPYEL